MKINLKKLILLSLLMAMGGNPVAMAMSPASQQLKHVKSTLMFALGMWIPPFCRVLTDRYPAIVLNSPHLCVGVSMFDFLTRVSVVSACRSSFPLRDPGARGVCYCFIFLDNALWSINHEAQNIFMYGCKNGYSSLVASVLERRFPFLPFLAFNAWNNPFVIAQQNNYEGFREAVKNGHSEVVDILLSNNAWFDVGANDHEPIVSCLQNNNHQVLQQLLAALAANNQVETMDNQVKHQLGMDYTQSKISRDEYRDFSQFLDWNMLGLMPGDGQANAFIKRLLYGCVHNDESLVFWSIFGLKRHNMSIKDIKKIDCGRGYSPLHLAVRFDSANAVKELCKLGHAVNCVNKEGLTPLELARKLGNKNAEELLLTNENINFKGLSGLENRQELIGLLSKGLGAQYGQGRIDSIKYMCGLLKHKHNVEPLLEKLAMLKIKNNTKNNDIARNIVSYLDGGDIVKKSKMQLLKERWDRSLDYAL